MTGEDIGTVRWFGVSWGAPVNLPEAYVPTPLGFACGGCNYPIEATDQGVTVPSADAGALRVATARVPLKIVAYHRHCFLRQIGVEVTAEVLREAAQEAPDVPYVAIGAQERAPWADEPLTCPECGAGPLPLEDSTPGDATGITLRFIRHCGKSWLRGDISR